MVPSSSNGLGKGIIKNEEGRIKNQNESNFFHFISLNYLTIIRKKYAPRKTSITEVFQGVEVDTCNTFPLKYFCPFRQKSARYFAASLTESPALTDGNASPNISVCTEPKAMLLAEMFFSFNSTASTSLRFINSALVEL